MVVVAMIAAPPPQQRRSSQAVIRRRRRRRRSPLIVHHLCREGERGGLPTTIAEQRPTTTHPSNPDNNNNDNDNDNDNDNGSSNDNDTFVIADIAMMDEIDDGTTSRRKRRSRITAARPGGMPTRRARARVRMGSPRAYVIMARCASPTSRVVRA